MKYVLVVIRFLFLIICCGKPNLGMAQNNTSNLLKDKIATYYEFVHQAELSIVKGEYSKAIDKYLLAAQKKESFTRDVRNLLTSCITIKDYNTASKAARVLLKRGVPYAYFEEKFFFKDFITSKAWKLVRKENVAPQVNVALREKLATMEKRDQEFRNDYDYYIDTIIHIDTTNREELLSIFNTYGYPNDAVVGVTMYNDTTIKRGWSTIDILLIHQIKNHKELFIPILENFLFTGQMHNRAFESHSKNFHPLNKYKLNCLESVQMLFIQVKDEVFTCCCKEEEKIDSLRKKYYLEPLKELRTKATFHYEHDRKFGFGGYSGKYDTDKGEEDILKIKEELLEQGFILYKKLDSERAYHKK